MTYRIVKLLGGQMDMGTVPAYRGEWKGHTTPLLWTNRSRQPRRLLKIRIENYGVEGSH